MRDLLPEKKKLLSKRMLSIISESDELKEKTCGKMSTVDYLRVIKYLHRIYNLKRIGSEKKRTTFQFA